LKGDIGIKALKQGTGLEPICNGKILVFTSDWIFSALFFYLKGKKPHYNLDLRFLLI